MPYKLVGKKKVWVDEEDYVLPQKTIQPVPAPGLLAAPVAPPPTSVAAPAVAPTPIGMSWNDLAALQFDLGQFGSANGFNNTGLRNSFTNLAKTIGYDGAPLQDTTFDSSYEGESGTVTQQMQGQAVSPELLKALQNYRYTTENTGDGRVKLGVFGQDGSQVGSYLHGTKDSGFDQLAYKAIPLGIAALGGAALGGFIPGAEIGAAGGASGAGSVASTIGAGEGAAQLAAYTAANPLTAAGVTAATLPAAGLPGLGAATAGGLLGAGEGAAQLAAYTAANPLTAAGVTASTLPAAGLPGLSAGLLAPAEALTFESLSQPQITQSLAGGLEPFIPELPVLGAETTAFGGIPDLAALGAGAPAQTAFGPIAAEFMGPVLPTPAPTGAVFNAAADSQLASTQLGITGTEAAAAATAPATVNLGSLGGTIGTAGGLQGMMAEASQALTDATTAPNVITGGGGLLGQAASVVNPGLQWLKDNPTLGRLLLGGATGLLSASGSSGSGSSAPTAGPAKQWSSPLQQGLLAPVQQYAPPAITQNKPMGLLAQGFQNDGAWRYLKG